MQSNISINSYEDLRDEIDSIDKNYKNNFEVTTEILNRVKQVINESERLEKELIEKSIPHTKPYNENSIHYELNRLENEFSKWRNLPKLKRLFNKSKGKFLNLKIEELKEKIKIEENQIIENLNNVQKVSCLKSYLYTLHNNFHRILNKSREE